MLMRRAATFLPLCLVLFSVPAQALTRISPTAVLAGGPAFTLRGFADDEAFDSDENTLTWRRADQPGSTPIRLRTSKVGNRRLEAQVPAELIAEPGDIFVGVAGVSGSFPFTILPASEKPIARDDYVTAYRDTERAVDVLANDLTTDEFDLTSVSIMRGARNGFVRANEDDGTVTYTPNSGFFGEDGFTYTVMDTRGVESDPAAAHITVKNEPPFTGCEFTPKNKQLLVHHHALYHPVVRFFLGLDLPSFGVRVKRDGLPVEAAMQVEVQSTREAFPGATGLPESRQAIGEIGSGVADFAMNPLVSGPTDQTTFSAKVMIDGAEHTCRGTVTTGLGVQLLPFLGALDSLTGGQARLPARRAPSKRLGNQLALLQIGRQPLMFEQKRTQAGGAAGFAARMGGKRILLSPQRVALSTAHGHLADSVTMEIVGGDPEAGGRAVEWLPGRSHYLMGNNPANWVTGVRQAAKVRFDEVYPGIDIVYYGNQRRLEYDLVVAPGGDPSQIRLRFPGLPPASLDEHGDLILRGTDASVRLKKPLIYQETGTERVEIAGVYRIDDAGNIRFDLGGYDAERALVIDPILEFSSYVGGLEDDIISDVALDADGNIYVAGTTVSPGLATDAAQQPGKQAGGIALTDGFVAKFDPTGSTLLYLTYIGGSGDDAGFGIAVDSGGNVLVTGSTSSPDFPTVRALQDEFGNGGDLIGADAFALKLNNDGSALVYSTYLGGSGLEFGGAVAVDANDHAYIVASTSSPDLPVVNALQPVRAGARPFTMDALVAKFAPDGEAVYMTYFGGSEHEFASGIAPDADGNAWVVGRTASTDLPAVNAFQNVNRGENDAFVIKLDAAGQALLFSSYLGGPSDDNAFDAAVDGEGNLYVTGSTGSPEFPIVNGAQPNAGSEDGLGTDAYVAKFSPDGSTLLYSTFFGGSGVELSHSIAVGADGSVYIAGETDSPDLPTKGAFQTVGGGGNDAYVMKLDPTGATIEYATYLGGSGHDGAPGVAVDTAGNAYVAGVAFSADFPVTAGVFQTSSASAVDSFVAKLAPGLPQPTITTVSAASFDPSVGMAPEAIASGFGDGLASGTEIAVEVPLPVSLLGTVVKITDSEGVEQLAPLFFVSPGQINYLVPAGTATGPAQVVVEIDGLEVSRGPLPINQVAPSLLPPTRMARAWRRHWPCGRPTTALRRRSSSLTSTPRRAAAAPFRSTWVRKADPDFPAAVRHRHAWLHDGGDGHRRRRAGGRERPRAPTRVRGPRPSEPWALAALAGRSGGGRYRCDGGRQDRPIR